MKKQIRKESSASKFFIQAYVNEKSKILKVLDSVKSILMDATVTCSKEVQKLPQETCLRIYFSYLQL